MDYYLTNHNRPIDWEDFHQSVLTEGSGINLVTDVTLERAIKVGLATDESGEKIIGESDGSNPLPMHVLEKILYACEYTVRHPHRVLGYAFANNNITPKVFERLIYENWWHGSASTLLADATLFQKSELSSMIKLNMLTDRFRHTRHVLLYRAIEANQPFDVLRIILEFGLPLEESFSTIRPNPVPNTHVGVASHREVILKPMTKKMGLWECSCSLQALVFAGRADVIEFLLHVEPPQVVAQDVLDYKLLHYVAKGRARGDDCQFVDNRLMLGHMLIQLSPNALGETDNDKRLPIRNACSGDDGEMIRMLMEEGMRLQVDSEHGRAGILHKDRFNDNALQQIVENCDILNEEYHELINYMIGSTPPLLIREDIAKYHLLHRVINRRNDSIEAARTLIQLDPEALAKKNDFGNLPIQSVIEGHPPSSFNFTDFPEEAEIATGEEVLELFISAAIENNIFPEELKGGLLIPNSKGFTTLDLIFRYCGAIDEMRDQENFDFDYCEEKFWQELEICVRISHEIPLLQAALRSKVSSGRLAEIIKRFESCVFVLDRHGRTPLHVAVESDRDCFEDLKLILELNPDAASIRDKNGRLPLHIALEKNNFEWSFGIKQIIDANKSAVEEVDVHNGMYPFMMAAAIPCHEIDSMYNLLRHSPHSPHQLMPAPELSAELISNCVDRKRKKRRLDSEDCIHDKLL
jgi:hypothetical protein